MAGIWQVNWPLVKFYMPGFDFKAERFGGRIQVLSDEKWFIPKFVKFQYGELQATNRMHQRIIFELEKEGVSIPHKSPSQGAKDKDKESLIVKEGSAEGRTKVTLQKLAFDTFWKYYPKKVGKGAAEKAWQKVDHSLLTRILTALRMQGKSLDWQKDGGQFIPHPATWLNQRRWEDEIGIPGEKPPPTPEQRKAAEDRYQAMLKREVDKVISKGP